MNELIKIQDKGGHPGVDARELHAFLEVGKDFSTWMKDRINKYDFQEGQDYSPILGKSIGGRPSVDYAISLDMAKELAMVENNEKGKQARKYFIEKEKELRQVQKPQTSLEVLAGVVKALQDQERQQKENDRRLSIVEAKLETSQTDFFTVAGYASLRGLRVDISHAQALGRKASTVSQEYGYETGKASDPRFGTVKTYHLDILKIVFDGWTGK